MKANRLLALGLLSLTINNLAWGQTACPSGVPAGDPRCGPSPSWHGGEASLVEPTPRWATRWGAIAIDDTVSSGGVGTATGMSSKRKAEKAALTLCRSDGGAGCRIVLAYYNQCGVIAWGDQNYTGARAATIEQASQRAILTCNQATTNCRVYYADCSLPERIQ